MLDIDQAGLDFIARWEGVRLMPYRCPAGFRTIGIGHRIHPDEYYPDGQAITQDEARRLLRLDCQAPLRGIRRNLPVALTQNQINALVSFAFNVGTGPLLSGSVHNAVLSGGNVPAALVLYSKARVNGVLKTLPGLLARRQAEGKLWLSD